MFRKKDTETELPATGEGAFRRPAAEAGAKTAAQPELPRRKVDLPTAPGGSSGSAPAAAPTGAEALGSTPPQAEPDRYGGNA